MTFNPNNYKVKVDEYEKVASEHGYKKPYFLAQKVGEPSIMRMENNDGEYERPLQSNPGETKKQWFTRLGWI